MADGRTHATASTSLAVLGGLMAWGSLGPGVGKAVFSGAMLQIIINPDLDHHVRTISESLVYKMFGWFVGSLFWLYWRPYSLILSHRHWLSHHPGISTVVRVIYSLPMFWGISIVLSRLGVPPVSDPTLYFWTFVAMFLADVLHWLYDDQP